MDGVKMKKGFLEAALDGKSGQLTVVDRRNGAVRHVAQPAFSVSIWAVGVQRALEVTSDAPDCKAEVRGEGDLLTARYTWPGYGLSFSVEYRLKKDFLEVRVPYGGIKEEEAYLYRLMSVDVLPGMAGVTSADEGYFLLPNFCGVQCDFAGKTEHAENRSFIYMDQGQWEQYATLPVFGMKHGRAGFMGLITGGDFDAEVVTVLNGAGKRHCIYPVFHFRYSKIDAIDPVDRVVRYYFLDGRQAGYAGMAKKYRKYLLEEKGAVPFRDRVGKDPVLAYELGATTVKVFHAMKSRRPDGDGRLAVFTTFPETEKLVEDLVKAGLDKVSYQLTGWNPGGHDGQWPTRLPLERRLGGQEAFDHLRRHIIDSGHRISLHDNYADMYRCSPDWDADAVMTDRDGELIRGGVWGGGYSHIICPHCALGILRRELPEIKKHVHPTALYYLDAMPVPLRICCNQQHGHAPNRRAHAEGMVELWKETKKILELPVGTENITGYSVGVSDYAATIKSHVPPRPALTESGFSRFFVDRLVPFLPIAAHGLVKYHLSDLTAMESAFGSRENGLLKSIEYGALPRFEMQYEDKFADDGGYLHFGNYREMIDDAARHHEVLCRELGHLQTVFIDDHEQTGEESFVTTYEDGTRVEVNYRNQAYRIRHE